MSKAIAEKSTYVPAPAPAITATDIRIISDYIDINPQHPAIKAAILPAFATFIRVSNVLSPSINSWGGRHTLQAQDIHMVSSGLKVIIRSTKTRKGGRPHILVVFPAHNACACPVFAWAHYHRIIRPCPIGPAFMTFDCLSSGSCDRKGTICGRKNFLC